MPAPVIPAIGRKIRLYGCLGKHSARRRGMLPGLPCGACPGHQAADEFGDGVVPQAIPTPRGPSPEGMCYLMSARDWRHFSANASRPVGRTGRWSLFMAISGGRGTFEDGWSDGGWALCAGVAQFEGSTCTGARLATDRQVEAVVEPVTGSRRAAPVLAGVHTADARSGGQQTGKSMGGAQEARIADQGRAVVVDRLQGVLAALKYCAAQVMAPGFKVHGRSGAIEVPGTAPREDRLPLGRGFPGG
jgi:hypothetical protein